MANRRQVLVRLIAAALAWLSSAVGVVSGETNRTLSIAFESADADLGFVPGAAVDGLDPDGQRFVTPFPANDLEVAVDGGDGLAPDTRTVFEDIFVLRNFWTTPIDVTSVDDSELNVSLGPDENVDLRVDGESLVSGAGSRGNVLTVDPADGSPVTLVVDFLDNESVDISGTVTIRTAGNDDSGGDDCFLTAATGGEEPTLGSLRRFRDESMSATPFGRALTAFYYRISPPIAETIARHPEGRTARTGRWFARFCAGLSERQSETERASVSALLGVLLASLYVCGVFAVWSGHLTIRGRERIAG